MVAAVPQHPNEFSESLYRLAIWSLLARRVPRDRVEDPAQQAWLETWTRPDIYDLSPRDLERDIKQLAWWRFLDEVRKERRTTPLFRPTGDGGEEMVIDPPAKEPDVDGHAHARRLFERANPLFERGMRKALSGKTKSKQRKLFQAAIALARRVHPNDPLACFAYARIIVFSGTGAEKRDSSDIAQLALKLAKTPGAVQTALTRLQRVWRPAEKAAYSDAMRHYGATLAASG